MRQFRLTTSTTLRSWFCNRVAITVNNVSQFLRRGVSGDTRLSNNPPVATAPRRVLALSATGKLAASAFGRPVRLFNAQHISPASANTTRLILASNTTKSRVVVLR